MDGPENSGVCSWKNEESLMDIDQVTELFKWMTIINVSLLILIMGLFTGFRKVAIQIHSKLFGIEEPQVVLVVYKFLGGYKLLITVFNLVPLIALHLVR